VYVPNVARERWPVAEGGRPPASTRLLALPKSENKSEALCRETFNYFLLTSITFDFHWASGQ